MTIPTISTLPVAPARTDAPATFVTRADAFLAAMVVMQGELNTSIGAMNTDIAGIAANVTAAQAAQTGAETAETNAEAAQAAAESASNAALWVSGTSYSAGDVVYSPITYFSYRANTSFTSTTDPSLDSVNWVALTASGGGATVELVATGTISGAGVTVALRSDGTVEQVTSTGNPQSFGTPTETSVSAAATVFSCYDKTSNCVVVAWYNGGPIYAAAASISGDTLTFGTTATVASHGLGGEICDICSVTCSDDDTQTRPVVMFESNNPYQKLAALSISGTTITAGSAFLLEATGMSDHRELIDMPESQRFCALVVDDTQTYRLSFYSCAVTTGLSISSGSEYQVGLYASMGVVSNMRKIMAWSGTRILVVWSNYNNNRTEGRLMTPSGTGWSAGSTVTLQSGVTDQGLAVGYDPSSSKFIVTGHQKVFIATPNGTTISFDSGVAFPANDYQYDQIFYSESDNSLYFTGRYYDSGLAKYFYSVIKLSIESDAIVIGTEARVNSTVNNLTRTVPAPTPTTIFITANISNNVAYVGFNPSTLTTNANNFIGFAQDAASDGADINVSVDYMIDANQSGLTPKTTYYIDYDGSLSGTATDYVVAGYALNATTIQVAKQ